MRELCVFLLFVGSCAAQDIEKPRVIQIQKALREAGYHVSINGMLIGRTYDSLRDVADKHGWQEALFS